MKVALRAFEELAPYRLAQNAFDFGDARKAEHGYWSLYVMGMLAGDSRG